MRPRLVSLTTLGLAVGLLLSDNLVWFSRFPLAYARSSKVPGVRITADQREVLAFLAAPEWKRHILLSEDSFMGYLATAYTPLHAWVSHWIETPEYDRRSEEVRALFRDGAFRPEWFDRRILILMTRPRG